jgi:DNA-binding NtrC family response regulator
VLCIDDDVIQLEAYKYQLSDKFKKVVCLDSFPVEWNEEEWKSFDLIITDYKIGQMTISELAEGSNTAMYKELDWILVSGFDIDQLPETMTFKFKFKFQKPVRIQEVLDQLRQLYVENLWEEPQMV